jgi:pimeloyl-ACP methyl ester carboxylesterase
MNLVDDTPTAPEADLDEEYAESGDSGDSEPIPEPAPAPPDGPPRRPWWRRWARRVALAVAVMIVAVTVASFAYNAATEGTVAPPAGLSYVRTGDVMTRYRTWGPASGTAPTVVLIPGFIENADLMAPVAAALAESGLHVESYDVRGFGYTQHLPPYDTAAQARQLADFIAARHLDANGREPVLVGHSSGAGVIAAYLDTHPHGASGVLFLDGDGLSGGVGHPPTWLFINPYRTSLMRLAVRSDWVIRTVYNAQCGPRCFPLDAVGMALWRRPLQVAGAESALWAMAGTGPAGVDPAGVARVGALGLPTAAIFGAEDSVYSAGDEHATEQRLHAAFVDVIPHARHLAFISDSGRVAADVERLVRVVTSSPHR